MAAVTVERMEMAGSVDESRRGLGLKKVEPEDYLTDAACCMLTAAMSLEMTR